MNAICRLGIVPVRAKPGDREEMTTQLLYGECVNVLERQGDWMRMRSQSDGYEGWVDRKQMEGAESAPGVIGIVCAAVVRTGIGWLPMGSLLRKNDPLNAALPKAAVRNSQEQADADYVLYLARQFQGAPYLWGGKSVLGVDCSGLTQTVFRTAGYPLPRDSPEQAGCGTEVTLAGSRNADLAFFRKPGAPDRVTHVGIVESEGDRRFVRHASGRVRRDLLDAAGLWNDQGILTHELLGIRRVLP